MVTAALERFNRRDVEAALEYMHPDVVWSHERLTRVTEAVVYRGRGEVRRFWNNFLESFQRFEVHLKEIRSGVDWVACVTVIRGVGRGSELEVEAPPLVYLYEVEGGLISRVTGFPDMSDALGEVERS